MLEVGGRGSLGLTLHAEDKDVILLAKFLRGVCELSSGHWMAQQFGDAVEAKEFARFILCFGDPVRHEHQRVTHSQIQTKARIFDSRYGSKR